MSVVTWDGRYLAADRLVLVYGQVTQETTKLVELDHHVVAGVGRWDDVEALTTWVRDGMDPDDFPMLHSDDGDGGSELLILDKKTLQVGILRDRPQPVPLKMPTALGAGSTIAMTATAMGKSAPEAVAIANQLSPYCGFGVDVYDIKSPKKGVYRHTSNFERKDLSR